MTKLVEQLSDEDKDWRSNTVVLMDGAKYLNCTESQQCLKSLGLQVCISALYLNSAARIENAFGFLKF